MEEGFGRLSEAEMFVHTAKAGSIRDDRPLKIAAIQKRERT